MEDKPIGSWFPLEQLKEWPDNPRIIDTNTIEAVARSIDEFGFASPIVARRENHQIICGHTRFRAAKLLKLDFVPTRFLDLNQEEANRLALADNKLINNGSNNIILKNKIIERIIGLKLYIF